MLLIKIPMSTLNIGLCVIIKLCYNNNTRQKTFNCFQLFGAIPRLHRRSCGLYLARLWVSPATKFRRRGPNVCSCALNRKVLRFFKCQCSCKMTLVTKERMSAKASSPILGTVVWTGVCSEPRSSRLNFSGRPGIYAVLVKCWYHLSAFRANVCGYTTNFIHWTRVMRESFSSTVDAHIFLICSSACRRLADLLLAVRDGTMGG